LIALVEGKGKWKMWADTSRENEPSEQVAMSFLAV
jgi:hypothetical protein